MASTPIKGAGTEVDERGMDFADWLDSAVVEVMVSYQHDQWYAVAEQFGVAGTGKTQDDALRDLTGLLQAYLQSHFNEGHTYQQALRVPDCRPQGLELLAALITGLRTHVRRKHLVLPLAMTLRPRT